MDFWCSNLCQLTFWNQPLMLPNRNQYFRNNRSLILSGRQFKWNRWFWQKDSNLLQLTCNNSFSPAYGCSKWLARFRCSHLLEFSPTTHRRLFFGVCAKFRARQSEVRLYCWNWQPCHLVSSLLFFRLYWLDNPKEWNYFYWLSRKISALSVNLSISLFLSFLLPLSALSKFKHVNHQKLKLTSYSIARVFLPSFGRSSAGLYPLPNWEFDVIICSGFF